MGYTVVSDTVHPDGRSASSATLVAYRPRGDQGRSTEPPERIHRTVAFGTLQTVSDRFNAVHPVAWDRQQIIYGVLFTQTRNLAISSHLRRFLPLISGYLPWYIKEVSPSRILGYEASSGFQKESPHREVRG